MWWKLLLLTLYLGLLFILSRILETVAYYEGHYLATSLLDPVSLSVRKLKTLLDQRGISYAGVVEKKELTDLIEASGDATEGELEAAALSDDSSTSTNFTCGTHFYEEVKDTKDSVWVVQVIRDQHRVFMPHPDWKAFVKKVSRFGVRTGVFDCSLDWRLCNKKNWYDSRLVLALPQGHQAKGSVVLKNYLGSPKVQAVFDWVNLNLASRIKEISSVQELERDWYTYDDSKEHSQLRLILVSAMNIPPMFFSVLSVRFTGRIRFGTINATSKEGKTILKKLKIRKIPTYQVITPEKNYTFGYKTGEYLNFNSLDLLLRTIYPEVNDIFLLSLVIVNVMCWFEVFIVPGNLLKRLGSLLWLIGKWNCLLILMWLPILGLCQLPFVDSFLNHVLMLIRTFSMTWVGCLFRSDWLWYTSSSCSFLVLTFLVFASVAGMLFYLYKDPETLTDNNNSHSGWLSFHWDLSYLSRPVATLTRPMSPQELDLEVGMEMLIERLAVPNFWLRPMISTDYIKELPVWKYTGPSIDSDFGSDYDSPSPRIDSDCDDVGSGGETGQLLNMVQRPLMFICEKCRALQNNRDNRSKSEEELEEERMESESACAKFLMDGDYKCLCQSETDHDHQTQKKSPKKDRSKRSPKRSHDNEQDADGAAQGDEEDVKSPPGVIATTECVICLESHKFGVFLCGLPCGHSFHQPCIMGWLTRDNHCCPVCRWPAYKAKPCSMHLHAE